MNQFGFRGRIAPGWLGRSNPRGELLDMAGPYCDLQKHYSLTYYVMGLVPVGFVILKLVCDDLRDDGFRACMRPVLTLPIVRWLSG